MNVNKNNKNKYIYIRVWDLPLRLFHLFLILSIIGLFITAKLAEYYTDNSMMDNTELCLQYHFYCGYTVLILLLFRFIWGVIGSHYSRFSSFLPNPKKALHVFKYYLNNKNNQPEKTLGHNPLGALSVYALLGDLLFQAITGLFSNDSVSSEGPLAIKISQELSDTLTYLHKTNETIIIVLLLLHLSAIAFYHFKRKEPLITAMITGDKPLNEDIHSQTNTDNTLLRIKGVFVLLLCILFVYYITGFK